MTPQIPRQAGGFGVHARAERSDIDIRLAQHALGWRLFLQRHHQPVFADGEANARSGRPAERFGKAVITAAAEDCVLRSQGSVGELERGASVVIEAADQPVVYAKLDTRQLQNLLHGVEMFAANLRRETG